MKKIYLLIIAICTLSATAQKTENAFPSSNMSIQLNTNATSFIAGETLYYKIYLSNTIKQAPEKIGYVLLLGADRNPIFTQKHFLVDGDAHGDFFIPASIKTGSYKIIAYTAASAANHYFERNIIIVNPFQTSKVDESATELSIEQETKVATPYNLIQKSNFKSREQVSLNTALIPPGKYSVSVRKTDQLDRASINEAPNERINKSLPKTDINPEIRGEVISGSAFYNGTAARKINLALSIPGENPVFKIAKTDDEGRFVFTIPVMNPNSNIYIQPITKDDKECVINLDKSPAPDFSRLQFPAFKVPESLESDLRERMVAVQIRNSYVTSKADTIVPQALEQKFYEPIATEYELDKYTRFPTFAQTIVELLPEVYYLKDGSKFSVHVRDNNIGRTISEPTLLLIDGIMLQDATELFSFPMRNVDKISIVTGIYLYGPSAFNGVISLTTKNKNYEPKSVKVTSGSIIRPFVEKKYFRQIHSQETNRTPDFRQQLLWLPEINNNDTVSFFTSDLTGNFKVEITGVTDEGQILKVYENLSVRE